MPTKKPVTKRPPKTLKEKRFVKAYLETGNGVAAVRAAGYDVSSYSSAGSIATENLQKLEMERYLDAAGLTLETMAQNTARIALTAQKRDQFSGEMYEDNAAQLKGMEFAARLRKILATDTGGNTNNGTVNNFNFGELGDDALRALAQAASGS